MTNDLIDKVGREAFVAIKDHFDAEVGGADTLEPAESLTEEQVKTLNQYLANSLHMFPDFTV